LRPMRAAVRSRAKQKVNPGRSEQDMTPKERHERVICGHECNSANGNWKCYLRPDHAGWHEETFRLRDGRIERTNWGDDGLAMWAIRDKARAR
jgi:hypothetical protein